MTNKLAPTVFVVAIVIGLLTGCASIQKSETNQSSSTLSPLVTSSLKAMEEVLDMSDQKLTDKLAGLDLNVIDFDKYSSGKDYDFSFNNSSELHRKYFSRFTAT